MIPTSIKGNDLIDKRCRPVHPLRNGAGQGITPQSVCIITDVVRGHGISIRTEPCPHCGQCAYITGIDRSELELCDNQDNLQK